MYPEENNAPGAFEDFLRWSSVSDPDECNLSQEPISGKSDSIISLTIPGVFRRNSDANGVNIWNPTFEPAANKDTVSNSLPGDGSLLKARPRRSYSDKEKQEYGMPIPTTEWMSSASDLSRSTSLGETSSYHANGTGPSERKKAIQRGLHIPLMANEYQRDLQLKDVSGEAASNQNRLSMVAIVKFLSLFNIGNLPVFGLATTSGSKGIVSCGWMERREVASSATDSHRVHEVCCATSIILPILLTFAGHVCS